MRQPDAPPVVVETTVIPTTNENNRKNMPTSRIAAAGVLLALALILSLVESYIPPLIPAAPYAKIGFANIVLIIALLLLGYRYCLLIVVVKCVFTGIFSGNMFSIVYSLPAGIVAYSVSALLFKSSKTGITAVSAVSSVLHNFVQVAVAAAIIGRASWLTAPYLLAIGAASGVGVGIVSFLILKALPQRVYDNISE